jgi:DNA ligase (NAD+)
MTYEELKNLVNKHCHLYYDLSAPELSDAEFDSLYDTLVAFEKNQGWAAYDSPTNRVGGSIGKVEHPYKLYSLRKVYDIEEIDDYYDVKTPKIDGTNITLIYRRGRLKLALTRGNGERGDNVIHLASTIDNVPQKINTIYDEVVVNGECVTDNEVDNFRNYVSGALGLKSAAEFKQRNIKFVAHDYLGIELSYTKRMQVLSGYGFTTVFDESVSKYPQDGVVYRIDNYSRCVQLGYTSKYPKFAVALKQREANTAITTLQDVIWAVGRTGTVNPTGIISPVVLEDATISRITLHNIGIIEENNLGLGDTIKIERAGGVIPKFISVVEHAKHNHKITIEHAEKALNLKLRREGPKLFTIEKSESIGQKVIEHFVKTMEIKGLGPASLKKMNFNTPADIFECTNWDKLGANGEKIKIELDKAKNKPYNQVLAALGIPGVGKSAAKLITVKIPKFEHIRDIVYTDIKGIGPSTVNSVMTWLEENEWWVQKLPLKLEETLQVADVVHNNTRKVCITGKLDMTRNDLAEILTKKGFTVSSTVTKDCYALITGGDTTSSKYVKAQNNGVTIIDYWSSKKEVLEGNF